MRTRLWWASRVLFFFFFCWDFEEAVVFCGVTGAKTAKAGWDIIYHRGDEVDGDVGLSLTERLAVSLRSLFFFCVLFAFCMHVSMSVCFGCALENAREVARCGSVGFRLLLQCRVRALFQRRFFRPEFIVVWLWNRFSRELMRFPNYFWVNIKFEGHFSDLAGGNAKCPCMMWTALSQ